MSIKVGDKVVCVRPNVKAPFLIGKVGVVDAVSVSGSYEYRFYYDGYHIWSEVRPVTPLDLFLAGQEEDSV